MIACHGSPIASLHACRDVNGDAWLIVRHADRCISILRDQPKPECVATFVGDVFLGAVAEILTGTPSDRGSRL